MDGYTADASELLCGAGGRMDIHQQHGRPHQQHVKILCLEEGDWGAGLWLC